MRDFSKATIAALARKGIRVIGPVAIPADGPMPYANATRGYALDDNGCHRIRTFNEVLELAK